MLNKTKEVENADKIDCKDSGMLTSVEASITLAELKNSNAESNKSASDLPVSCTIQIGPNVAWLSDYLLQSIDLPYKWKV